MAATLLTEAERYELALCEARLRNNELAGWEWHRYVELRSRRSQERLLSEA